MTIIHVHLQNEHVFFSFGGGGGVKDLASNSGFA